MLLECQKISKRFGGLRAVHEASLTARSGEITALIGPNGAGKSTLLDCLTGVKQFDSGQVVIGGTAFPVIRTRDVIEMGITRTFQNIRLFASLTAHEHVALARRGFLRSGRGCRCRGEGVNDAADRLLQRVGLARKSRLRPHELSYGERRLLEIARGLATEPRVLMLDEPAAGSTLSEQARLAALVKEIAAGGVAVVMVEHHMNVVAEVSTNVVVLNFGEVIVTGPLEAVRRDPQVISVYLGSAG